MLSISHLFPGLPEDGGGGGGARAAGRSAGGQHPGPGAALIAPPPRPRSPSPRALGERWADPAPGGMVVHGLAGAVTGAGGSRWSQLVSVEPCPGALGLGSFIINKLLYYFMIMMWPEPRQRLAPAPGSIPTLAYVIPGPNCCSCCHPRTHLLLAPLEPSRGPPSPRLQEGRSRCRSWCQQRQRVPAALSSWLEHGGSGAPLSPGVHKVLLLQCRLLPLMPLFPSSRTRLLRCWETRDASTSFCRFPSRGAGWDWGSTGAPRPAIPPRSLGCPLSSPQLGMWCWRGRAGCLGPC